MIKATRNKETCLNSKVDHNKGKSDFLYEIVNNITSERLLFQRVKTKSLLQKSGSKNFLQRG